MKLSSCCLCSLFPLCLHSLFPLCLCSLFPICLCSLFPVSMYSLFPLCLYSLFLFVQSVSSFLYSLFPLCAVCFLFAQSFSSLSVQSVSLCLCSLFRFVCAVCFLLCHNGDAEQTTTTYTHCLRHCMQRFFKIPFVSHTQSQKQKVRQASETEREKQKQVWKAPVMCRNLYSTHIDRTRDVSKFLLHPCRHDPRCVLFFIPSLSTGPVMCRSL